MNRHGLLTTAEAAAACRLSIRQFRRIVDRDRLTVVRTPGGNVRFHWIEVHRLIERHGLGPVRVPVEAPVGVLMPEPPPLPVVEERPACRLCRREADHRDAGPCVHCSLWVCADHLVEHLDGLDWPAEVAS